MPKLDRKPSSDETNKLNSLGLSSFLHGNVLTLTALTADRKSTTGCVSCKRRKVKCDEQRPSCSACARHRVQCEYLAPKPRSQGPSAASRDRGPDQGKTLSEHDEPQVQRHGDGASDLELRLFHYFLTHTRYGLRETNEFWGVRAPLIAFDHRPVFDAMLAVAALHMYRQMLDETFIFYRNPAVQDTRILWTLHGRFLAGRTPREMFSLYLHYFDSAVKGQQELMQEDDLRAAYVSSLLISVMCLFSLGIDAVKTQESDLELDSSRLWFTVAIGPRELMPLWLERSGMEVLREMGVFDGPPNFQNVDDLFHPDHARPFESLLHFGTAFETITTKESLAYQQALSYIGLIWRNLVHHAEEPLVISRRYIALPTRTPPLFSEMVLQQRYRALAILAHAFAIMRLLEDDVPWYRGIAAKQVPAIGAMLPSAWQQAMMWPRAMLLVSPSKRTSLPDPTSTEYRLPT